MERSKCCSTATSRPLEIHRGVFIPFSSRRASRLEFPYQLRQVSATTRGRARKSWLYLPQKLFPVFPPSAKELDVIQQPLGLQTSLSLNNLSAAGAACSWTVCKPQSAQEAQICPCCFIRCRNVLVLGCKYFITVQITFAF